MSERIVAIVPIRSLRNGKTRLAATLPREAREALLRRTAAEVIATAVASQVVARVLVVSPEAEVLEWASALGADVTPLFQPATHAGLNGAIDAGREWAMAHGHARILSLFADLPLLASDDVVAMAVQIEAVVLGPDRRGEGTNALLLRLDREGAQFRFAFGEQSLARHKVEAERLGLATALVDRPGIGFDLDTPSDWDDFLETVAAHDAAWDGIAACGGVCAG